MYPYCPPHITKPKVFLKHKECCLSVLLFYYSFSWVGFIDISFFLWNGRNARDFTLFTCLRKSTLQCPKTWSSWPSLCSNSTTMFRFCFIYLQIHYQPLWKWVLPPKFSNHEMLFPEQRYGPVISTIPQQLSRFHFNMISSWSDSVLKNKEPCLMVRHRRELSLLYIIDLFGSFKVSAQEYYWFYISKRIRLHLTNGCLV